MTERREGEREDAATNSEESQPSTTKRSETGTTSVFFRTSADLIPRPVAHTTSPKMVSIPFTSIAAPPHPNYAPIPWLCPYPYSSLVHGTTHSTTAGPTSTEQPRVFHSLPATLPPPLLPQNPPTADNPGPPPPTAPLRPNLRPPSTIPIDGETPPRRGRATLTPMMSIGVRESEWLQLTQLGLGKGLDATNPHPWASKSAYQAKDVEVSELVLTNEGQRLKNYVEVIDNYFNVQGSLEGAIRLPHQPIEIGVAADTHRSYCLTQELRGKTVYTRTVSFSITADDTQKSDEIETNDYETPFQYQLMHYLERGYKRMRDVERNRANDMRLCLDFLHSLGGITHYVSSITLGAMEYSVKKVQALDIGGMLNSRAGFGPMAGARVSNTMRKSKRKKVQHDEKIGRISENDHVRPHSHDEAVIRYSITSLANLVRDQRLRDCVQKAIQNYITSRLHRINGPYYIMTPERTMGGRNIYWRVVEERERVVTHFIQHTTSKEEASIFFIRPDYRKVGRYFFITTFDHSKSTRAGKQLHAPLSEVMRGDVASHSEPGSIITPENTDQPLDDSHDMFGDHGNYYHGNRAICDHSNASVVERYVHVSTRSFFKHVPNSCRIRLKAKAAVRPDFARFQLVDRRDRTPKTLLESDWLPDKSELQGQPFFLRQYYHITKCLGISGFSGEDPGSAQRANYYFTLSKKSCHKEGRCHMLFQLVRAETADFNPNIVD